MSRRPGQRANRRAVQRVNRRMWRPMDQRPGRTWARIAALALTLAAGAAPLACMAVTQAAGQAAPQAVDANGQLLDQGLQARFERITQELRCLVCQNESIADSNADLAVDLRQQVREMLVAGKTNEAIFDFMTNRYGEFVRFSPPLEPKTLLIWGAPFVMLLLGGGIIYRVVRQRSRMPLDDEPAAGPETK
jgi:cytochrome c-type biogenesis protein CcmH